MKAHWLSESEINEEEKAEEQTYRLEDGKRLQISDWDEH